MMSTLFSVFDPLSQSGYPLHFILILPMAMCVYTFPNSPISILVLLFPSYILKELHSICSGLPSLVQVLIPTSCLVVVVNLMGHLVYVFTLSTQLSLILAISFPLWLSGPLLMVSTSPSTLLQSLVPLGCPLPLASFMVLIESVSLVIRPLTLSVRLMANMVAGHLLIGLVSAMSVSVIFPLVILAHWSLLILELAVALIQSYVIVVLLALYNSE